MKILRNCWMSVRYAFRYAPVNAALLVLGYNIPGLFSGLQIVVIQRLVDGGILYAQSGDGFRQMLIYGICLVGMMFSWGVLQKFAGYERTPIEAKLTQKLSPMVMEKMENLEYSVFEDQGAQEVSPLPDHQNQELLLAGGQNDGIRQTAGLFPGFSGAA
ncbi:MAG: hypothetical protein LUC95_11320 [Lachnospiraceae bacterium]|nr:hypothetical protein [Lachnospiraceae bacterium]